jgi:hypothetical protein
LSNLLHRNDHDAKRASHWTVCVPDSLHSRSHLWPFSSTNMVARFFLTQGTKTGALCLPPQCRPPQCRPPQCCPPQRPPQCSHFECRPAECHFFG